MLSFDVSTALPDGGGALESPFGDPSLDERRLFFGMVREHRVPEFLCHEWPLFWQPEFTDKPPMWQSRLAGLSMQSA